MILPPVLVLTDRHQAEHAGHRLVDLVAALQGADVLVVLREKDLPSDERRGWALEVGRAAVEAGVPFVIASDSKLAVEVSAAGVHLAADDSVPAEWPPLIGRSCHGLGDLVGAQDDGVDYVTLSPVFETVSKPGYGPALGPDGLRSMIETTSLPVYALGGITPATVGPCIEAGALGVAVMGSVMRAEHPAAAAAAFVEAVRTARLAAGREVIR